MQFYASSSHRGPVCPRGLSSMLILPFGRAPGAAGKESRGARVRGPSRAPTNKDAAEKLERIRRAEERLRN